MAFSYIDSCDNIRTVEITETVVYSFEVPSTLEYLDSVKWLQDQKTEFHFVSDWISNKRRFFRIYIPDPKLRTLFSIKFS